MIYGWFTGVGLPKYFNSTTEDPINARRIVNGTDRASTIAGYYWKFKKALS
jgi:putative chitinase